MRTVFFISDLITRPVCLPPTKKWSQFCLVTTKNGHHSALPYSPIQYLANTFLWLVWVSVYIDHPTT